MWRSARYCQVLSKE